MTNETLPCTERAFPTTELREIPHRELPLMANSAPVQPNFNDFRIGDVPLFQACQEYLAAATTIAGMAREIAAQVHGSKALASPFKQPCGTV